MEGGDNSGCAALKITLVACVVQCARVCACVLCSCCRPFLSLSSAPSLPSHVLTHQRSSSSTRTPTRLPPSRSRQPALLLVARPPLLPPHPRHQAPLFSRRSHCSTRLLRGSYCLASSPVCFPCWLRRPYIARVCLGGKVRPPRARPRSLPRSHSVCLRRSHHARAQAQGEGAPSSSAVDADADGGAQQ